MPQEKEFDLINRHFAPLAKTKGALGLLDDAAFYEPAQGRELVLTTDTIVESVHYLPDTPPELVAAKLFGVNISDLAAKGATPKACLLTFAPPKNTSDGWIAAFAGRVGEELKTYGIALLGGDTVASPGHAVFGLTLVGEVAPGAMVTRAGARPGDGVFVTGTVGHGFLGLEDARAGRASPFRTLFEQPRPPLSFALEAAGCFSSAVDVSDGLIQDLGHICRASGCGMRIETAAVPFADPAREDRFPQLTGGDDYQLAFTAAPDDWEALRQMAARKDVALTPIGKVAAGDRPVLLDADGREIPFSGFGFSHF